jgi:hypothetical protein
MVTNVTSEAFLEAFSGCLVEHIHLNGKVLIIVPFDGFITVVIKEVGCPWDIKGGAIPKALIEEIPNDIFGNMWQIFFKERIELIPIFQKYIFYDVP